MLPVFHLAEADGRGGDLNQFVVGDVLHGLLQTELARRDESKGFIGSGGPDVCQLFFLRDITQISSAREFSPTTIPAYTGSPEFTKIVPRGCR